MWPFKKKKEEGAKSEGEKTADLEKAKEGEEPKANEVKTEQTKVEEKPAEVKTEEKKEETTEPVKDEDKPVDSSKSEETKIDEKKKDDADSTEVKTEEEPKKDEQEVVEEKPAEGESSEKVSEVESVKTEEKAIEDIILKKRSPVIVPIFICLVLIAIGGLVNDYFTSTRDKQNQDLRDQISALEAQIRDLKSNKTAGDANTSATVVQGQSSDLKNYSDKVFNISFQYPKTWTIDSPTKKDSKMTIWSDKCQSNEVCPPEVAKTQIKVDLSKQTGLWKTTDDMMKADLAASNCVSDKISTIDINMEKGQLVTYHCKLTSGTSRNLKAVYYLKSAKGFIFRIYPGDSTKMTDLLKLLTSFRVK